MQLGIHFAYLTYPGGPEALSSILAGTAKAAEESGCAWFTMMDHWFQMESWATAQNDDLSTPNHRHTSRWLVHKCREIGCGGWRHVAQVAHAAGAVRTEQREKLGMSAPPLEIHSRCELGYGLVSTT